MGQERPGEVHESAGPEGKGQIMTGLEIGAAIQAANAALTAIKTLAGTVTQAQDKAEAVTVLSALAELGTTIGTLQIALAELRTENEDLKRELQAACDVADLGSRLQHAETVYWKLDGAGKRVGGPFCPYCWDRERKLVHLNGIEGKYQCDIHKATFYTSDWNPRF